MIEEEQVNSGMEDGRVQTERVRGGAYPQMVVLHS